MLQCSQDGCLEEMLLTTLSYSYEGLLGARKLARWKLCVMQRDGINRFLMRKWELGELTRQTHGSLGQRIQTQTKANVSTDKSKVPIRRV